MTTADPGELADYTPPEEMEPPPEGFLLVPDAVVEGAASENIIMDRHLALYHADPPVQAADLGELEERVRAQMAAVQEGLTLTISSLEERRRADVASLLEAVNASLSSLATQFITSQSELTTRQEAQAQIEEAAGEGGLVGFIRGVAGFALSPIESLLETISEYILGEVTDGLNS